METGLFALCFAIILVAIVCVYNAEIKYLKYVVAFLICLSLWSIRIGPIAQFVIYVILCVIVLGDMSMFLYDIYHNKDYYIGGLFDTLLNLFSFNGTLKWDMYSDFLSFSINNQKFYEPITNIFIDDFLLGNHLIIVEKDSAIDKKYKSIMVLDKLSNEHFIKIIENNGFVYIKYHNFLPEEINYSRTLLYNNLYLIRTDYDFISIHDDMRYNLYKFCRKHFIKLYIKE